MLLSPGSPWLSEVSVRLLVPALMLIGCGDGPILNPTRTEPVVTITSHDEGAAVVSPGTLRFVARASDAETSEERLSVSWFIDGEGICPEAAVTADGETECITEVTPGRRVISVLVVDGDGQQATAAVTLEVEALNTTPRCGISAPDDGTSVEAGTSILLRGTVLDDETAGDQLLAAWTSSLEGPLGTFIPASDGSVRLAVADLRPGTHVLGLEAEDPVGLSCSSTISVTVVALDAPPVATGLSLTPASPVTGDDLTALPEGEDPEGDTLTWTYTWTVDGDVLPSISGPTLPAVFRGEVVSVSAVASDGTSSSGSVTAGPITVGNAPPVATSVAVSPPSPGLTDDLTCTPGGWSDAEGDLEDYHWEWLLANVPQPGLTTQTVIGGTFPRGSSVRCRATPFDGVDVGADLVSAAVGIGNGAPQVTGGALLPAAPTVRDTLTLSGLAGSDPDGDDVSFRLSWRVDSVEVSTSTQLVLAPFHRGALVEVVITPNDGIEDGLTRVLSAPIANAPPHDATVSISPGAPRTADVVWATWSASDADGDTLQPSFVWRVEGAVVGGVSGDRLTAANTARGQLVRVVATIDDGFGGQVVATSEAVRIGNTLPTAPEVVIEPRVSDTTVPVQCTLARQSLDADADPIAYQVSWQVNGVPWAGATTTDLPGDTLPAGAMPSGRWTCTVTPSDGTDTGPSDTDVATITGPVRGVVLASGGGSTCAVLQGGDVLCWGANASGQLGRGDTAVLGDDPGELASAAAVALGSGRTAVGVAVGAAHACALLDDGSVKCWGASPQGQLGLGDMRTRGDGPNEMGGALQAVELGGSFDVVQLVAGARHTCARSRDGGLKCWGANDSGQLGQGDTAPRGDGTGEMGAALGLVDLGTGMRAVDVALLDGATCALLHDGTVKCWGDATSGRLGLGDLEDRGDEVGEMGDDLPVVALASTSVADLTAGLEHVCARYGDGRVQCWGQAASGRLGAPYSGPQGDDSSEMGLDLAWLDLGPGRTAVSLEAGAAHTCAVLDNGAVSCWGDNMAGVLGQGDTEDRGDQAGELAGLDPVQLHSTRGVRALAAADTHTCAVLACGSVQCWGSNSAGRLGLGDTRDRGDQPRELGDALPTLELGGRGVEVDVGDPAACVPWSHVITVDGDDADWLPSEVFGSSAGGDSAVMVSWDETWLYLGVRHPDVSGGGAANWFVAYFGDGTDRAWVRNRQGLDFGYLHNTQLPALAVEAQVAFRVKADLSFDQLAYAQYPAGVATWEAGDGYLSSQLQGSRMVEDQGRDVIELRIRRDELGLRDRLYLQTHWLFEGTSFESSYSAVPADMFPDSSYNPDFETFLRFELDHPDGPEVATSEPGVLP